MMLNGELYPQPTSARPISGSDSSSWPTPTVSAGDHYYEAGTKNKVHKLPGAARAWATPLEDDANNVTRDSGQKQSLARDSHRWSTPRAEDGERGENSQHDGLMEDVRNWATPISSRGGSNLQSRAVTERGHGRNLEGLAKSWATPTEQDSSNNANPSGYNRNSDPLNVEAKKFEDGPTRSQSEEPTERSASSPAKRLKRGLNPRFGLWLMGFPVEWLD